MQEKPAASLLTLEVEQTGSTAVVKCHGKLVAGATDRLYLPVKLLIPVCKRVVLDLADLSRMDSMGLGTLVRLYVSARASGCELELLNLGKQVQQLLGTTNMLSVFTVIGERGIKMG
jgi:anti-sigma B factor antagonist